MKRLLILPTVATVCAVELWRRGAVAPLAYGCRVWGLAIKGAVSRTSEPDPVG